MLPGLDVMLNLDVVPKHHLAKITEECFTSHGDEAG